MSTRNQMALPHLGFVLLITLQGCLSSGDSQERIFKERLVQHKSDQVLAMDLRMTFGDQWEKVCLQSPYIGRADFESISEKNVPEFRPILDDIYVLWVFYKNGTARSLEIERVSVMDYVDIGTKCTSLQNPYLYMKVIGGEKKYFLDNMKGKK